VSECVNGGVVCGSASAEGASMRVEGKFSIPRMSSLANIKVSE
jgi:hypothetical protein